MDLESQKMDKTIIDSYNKNGFHIEKALLDKGYVANVADNLKRNFDNQLKFFNIVPPEDIYESLKRLHQVDLDVYKKTAGTLWRKMSVFGLTHHERIQQFVKDNFGWNDITLPGGQVVHVQANSLRIPNGYFGVAAHQDFPSIQGSLDGIVIWIPLVDVDINRYPLEVIPGSHNNGILPSIENNDSSWEVSPECYNETDFIPIECEVGDVVFMSYFTVHRSSQNGDHRLRLACSTRYDNPDEKTFIERTYPSAYIRTVNREQLFSLIT
jgi:ectoine hydroxylase-related dioxygenase (phytanoyl-CoA dioxygenase family)